MILNLIVVSFTKTTADFQVFSKLTEQRFPSGQQIARVAIWEESGENIYLMIPEIKTQNATFSSVAI